MLKKEIIWREILHQALTNKKTEFTQKELAQKFRFSLSTVFNSLKALRQSKIVETSGRNFKILDTEKLLYLWATLRNLDKDIIYQTCVSGNVREIEGKVVPEAVFGAFSAYVRRYQEAPADYDKVYIYLQENELSKIKNRFPQKKGHANLIVVAADPWLKDFGQLTPDCQIFVDLWNIKEWYAKDFLEALKQKIFS